MFRRKRRSDDDLDSLYDSLSQYGDLDEDFYQSGQRRRKFLAWLVALLIAVAFLICGVSFFLWQSGDLNLDPPHNPNIPAVVGDEQEQNAPIAVVVETVQETTQEPTTPFLTAEPTDSPTAVPSSTNNYLPQELGLLMLRLINEDRQAHGLTAVAWDPIAATAGQHHADDMVAYNYFSHWNQQGVGPENRYSWVGGTHVVFENLHSFSYTYEDGSGAAIENWVEIVTNAQQGLMNSPGHRANILDPSRTHVGVGMAYNAENGQFRLAQMFTNQYVALTRPLPINAQLGQQIVLQGQINGRNLDNSLLNLAYEPFPAPISIEALNRTSSYASAAESLETRRISLTFDEIVLLDRSYQPGYYHIRLFVDLPTGQAQILNHVVTVR